MKRTLLFMVITVAAVLGLAVPASAAPHFNGEVAWVSYGEYGANVSGSVSGLGNDPADATLTASATYQIWCTLLSGGFYALPEWYYPDSIVTVVQSDSQTLGVGRADFDLNVELAPPAPPSDACPYDGIEYYQLVSFDSPTLAITQNGVVALTETYSA